MPARILIVDDEPQLLQLLLRVFERAGYEVLTASDGETARDLLHERAHELDALILDVIIPPSGAAPVLACASTQNPRLAVVLASGGQLGEELGRALAAQGGVFLHKPFAPNELLRAVERLRADARGGAA